MIATISPASTLVCAHLSAQWPPKVLLVKRSDRARFLPGAHVFPGGRLEPCDLLLGEKLRKDLVNFSRIASYFEQKPDLISSHVAAALRETQEETGLVINKLDHIWPLSHWLTPSGESARFDTYFFLALLDQYGPTLAESTETSDHRWLSPTAALDHHYRQEIFMAPPTRAILERMAISASLADLISAVDKPIKAICPYFIEQGREKLLVLPGDPLHHEEKASQFIMATRFNFP